MPPLISMKLDIADQIKGIEELAGTQLPFTIARFLTLSAQDGQKAARGGTSVFQLRNDWTKRNIKITAATKQTLMSEVYTDTGNQKTGAPDYLPRQEEGGNRVPLGGHTYLAIPTNYLYKYTPKSRPIPDNLRPKALLPPGAQVGQQYAGSFSAGSRSSGTKRLITKGTMKKLKGSDFAAFLQTTKSGTICIFVRHGGFGYHGGSNDAEPWYVLVRSARVKPIFPMTQEVEAIVQANLDRNFDRAVAEVLINEALKYGLKVQF
jgi:hypothetical protein